MYCLTGANKVTIDAQVEVDSRCQTRSFEKGLQSGPSNLLALIDRIMVQMVGLSPFSARSGVARAVKGALVK